MSGETPASDSDARAEAEVDPETADAAMSAVNKAPRLHAVGGASCLGACRSQGARTGRRLAGLGCLVDATWCMSRAFETGIFVPDRRGSECQCVAR